MKRRQARKVLANSARGRRYRLSTLGAAWQTCPLDIQVIAVRIASAANQFAAAMRVTISEVCRCFDAR